MDAIKVGILLIDVNFKFHYANECAQNLMYQNNFFEFDSEGKIHCAKQYQHKFEQLIRNIQLDPSSLSAKKRWRRLHTQFAGTALYAHSKVI